MKPGLRNLIHLEVSELTRTKTGVKVGLHLLERIFQLGLDSVEGEVD